MKTRRSKRKADSLLAPAYEVIHMVSAICSLIRGNKGYQIANAIAAATDS